MTALKEALKCALLATLVAAVAFGIRLEVATGDAVKAAPALLDARLGAIGSTVNAELIAEIDKQAAELRRQLSVLTVLGATKITMGQLAKASKTFDANWPALLDNGDHIAQSADGIAADVKREADQLTKPQTFWGQLRSWLLTLARIYGAI